MRLRLSFALMAGVLAAGCTRTPPAAAPVTDARLLTISVVATTDLHGHVEALPWLSAHIETLRAKRRAEGGDVLLVDAGDMWQGTLESNLSEGRAVVRAFGAQPVAAAQSRVAHIGDGARLAGSEARRRTRCSGSRNTPRPSPDWMRGASAS